MQALLLEQQDGKTLASVQTLDESRLPEGDVLGSILPELYAPAKIRVFMPVRRCYSLAGALVKTTGVGWRSRRE